MRRREVEAAVLVGMFLHPNMTGSVAEILGSDDFADPYCKAVFDAALEVVREADPVRSFEVMVKRVHRKLQQARVHHPYDDRDGWKLHALRPATALPTDGVIEYAVLLGELADNHRLRGRLVNAVHELDTGQRPDLVFDRLVRAVGAAPHRCSPGVGGVM